jgi:hypothetical protein
MNRSIRKNQESKKNMIKKVMVLGIFLIVNLSLFNVIDADESLQWSTIINVSEPSGINVNVFFGEATDAYDGPTGSGANGNDHYDQPLPPAPPGEPYVRFYFDDGLSSLYSKLSGDYRSYPDTEKVWNLTVEWHNSSFTYIPTLTISWESSELYGCEYDTVELWNSTSKVADMLTQSSYVYTQVRFETPPGSGNYYWVDGEFQIIAKGTMNNPPYAPSDPNPSDHATEIDVNTDLSWTGGDPDTGDTVTYDVYFGTNNPPSKVVTGQSGTTYDPGTMSASKKYYWQIVVHDSHDATTSGPIWSFTTINNPPHSPNIPTGETDGYHGTSYTYATNATDPDDNSIFYLFDWDDGTDSGWIGPYLSGEMGEASHAWQSPGLYTIKVKINDEHGSESEWSQGLLVNMSNRLPYAPSSPHPENGATNVDIDIDLSWASGDPDTGDIGKYDVYLGTTSPPQMIIHNTSTIPSDCGVLNYEKTYYWKIVAWDNFDGSTTGPIWSFTTKSKSSSGNGGNTPNGQENLFPIADASASETSGFVSSLITFDGSLSSDQDGYIKKWSWDFGDGNVGNGEVLTHMYSTFGAYNVTLTVTDDKDATDADTIIVTIGTANNPPLKPIVNGTINGGKNQEYMFTAISTDLDNDDIRYIFNWGDGTTNTSDFLPNGTLYEIEHRWTSAGEYTLIVISNDDKTNSESTNLNVLIDGQYVGDLGYLLDNNGDKTYDVFYSNITKAKTTVKTQENGVYSIDVDGDGNLDYTYNISEGIITPITEEKTDTTSSEPNFPAGLALVTIMILICIVVIVVLYKKGFF